MTPKYECRVCKAATECTEIWKNENEEFMNCSAFVAPPPTNIDRIHNMTVEELTKTFITDDGIVCPVWETGIDCINENCLECFPRWLKEEVET